MEEQEEEEEWGICCLCQTETPHLQRSQAHLSSPAKQRARPSRELSQL